MQLDFLAPIRFGAAGRTYDDPVMTRFLAIVVGFALLLSAPASAHVGDKAQPRIAAGLSAGPGLERVLSVRLRDLDSGDPVRRARVTAFGETGNAETRTPSLRLSEVRPAVYRTPMTFPRGGAWTLRISVAGPKVVAAQASMRVRIEAEQPAGHGASHGQSGGVTTLPTAFDDSLTGEDYSRMAVLWIHSISAFGWILGVLVLAFGLSTRPGVLAEAARTRLANSYRRWGAWVHWGLVPLIVATGLYNMFYVSPFDLAWSADDWQALGDVPYGYLYESILVVKLGLFGVLLVTGTLTLVRTLRIELPVVPVTNPHPGFFRIMVSVLGPAGIVYLATIPLILAAAMALRYVHVLSHAAPAG